MSVDGVGLVERSFTADTASIREARRFVREESIRAGAGTELVGDAQLAVSELVTNAVEHGLPDPVTVSVVGQHDAIVVSVSSARTSAEIADPSTWVGPLPAVRNGRGLAIVRLLSDDVAVVATSETVTVHCTFSLR